jgi:hypothetical protein
VNGEGPTKPINSIGRRIAGCNGTGVPPDYGRAAGRHPRAGATSLATNSSDFRIWSGVGAPGWTWQIRSVESGVSLSARMLSTTSSGWP